MREREIMYIYMYYIEWWLLYCYVYIDHQDDFIKAQTGNCDSVLEEGLKSRTSCKLPGGHAAVCDPICGAVPAE